MSLDFDLLRGEGKCAHCGQDYETIMTANITHNLNIMAEEAGVYKALWRPHENRYKTAGDILPVLIAGLQKLKADPEHFKTFEPSNGWGSYDGLVEFLEKIIESARENRDAIISICR